MSKTAKDSAEVVEFMALFAQLKAFCDDTPDGLAELAEKDESVKDVCSRLSNAAFWLKRNERRARTLFAAPVAPAFLTAWRDYEERYNSVLSGALLPTLWFPLEQQATARAPTADLRWADADDAAEQQAAVIAQALDFAQTNAEQEERWVDQPDLPDRIHDGIAAWQQLRRETGFDLRGVFRRRALIPFVFVPRDVASRHGSAEKLSMLRNLQQAHDAFIFGATYGALALMRSIMEAVLRDHYRAQGKGLNERINNARGLPRAANQAALHRLRMLANGILHLDRNSGEALPKMDELQLEKEIVRLLFVLRALIEGVK